MNASKWVPWALVMALIVSAAWAGVTNFDSVTLDGDLIVGDDATVTDDLNVTGDLAVTGAVTGQKSIVTNAATTYAPAASVSGAVIKHATTTTSTITLPAAAAGLDFTIAKNTASGTLNVDVQTGDQIVPLTNSAGDKVACASAYGTLRVIAVDSTNWIVISSNQSWTDAN